MGTGLPFGEELRAELGAPRRGRRLGSSPRSRVWRAELSGTPVVVKQLVDGPEADERYAREVAALTLASRVDPPVVPVLLGADPAERVLVLEYLEHRQPREDWVIDYASALARLHMATGADDAGRLPAWSGPTHDDVDSFLGLARALGVAVPSGVRSELDGLVNRLLGAPGHALLHGDPCPGNDMHTGGGIRFIDFEQAALGNGLVELAYLRIGFPTCWCVTAPAQPLLRAAEAAYRETWRSATGTEVHGDLTDACAGWLLRGDALVERAHRGTADHLAEIPNRDWTWGTATARQRLVHRLEVVGRMAAAGEELKGLGQLAATVRQGMLTRWPALQPLPRQRP
ncbi:aminoglycoside phosphotransferase family protein [Kitasatospora sp. NBC_01250]|uniref:aminoglycoside phosphotransferase family protein n=1 Tax=unclassified Kitasatospora TaxID=2633591 RepID=UPI002E167517|nr:MULTISPECIES: aminoglycoside phosphotransferase family protein [unclassified Kitasatospora]WSJ71620.1 aminoglycoside phosphotransferase family protein [Kitasatospora sp. NBC_01302]